MIERSGRGALALETHGSDTIMLLKRYASDHLLIQETELVKDKL